MVLKDGDRAMVVSDRRAAASLPDDSVLSIYGGKLSIPGRSRTTDPWITRVPRSSRRPSSAPRQFTGYRVRVLAPKDNGCRWGVRIIGTTSASSIRGGKTLETEIAAVDRYDPGGLAEAVGALLRAPGCCLPPNATLHALLKRGGSEKLPATEAEFVDEVEGQTRRALIEAGATGIE